MNTISNSTKLANMLDSFEKMAGKLEATAAGLVEEANRLETEAETGYRAAAKIRALVP